MSHKLTSPPVPTIVSTQGSAINKLHVKSRGHENLQVPFFWLMHLSCFFRILCCLPVSSNNLPIVTTQLVNNRQAYVCHRVRSSGGDTVIYFSYKDAVRNLLPCLLEGVSLL